MRALLLAAALAVATPAVAQDFPGRWAHDATGELFEIAPAEKGAFGITGLAFGKALTLQPSQDKGANFKVSRANTFSTSECLYTVTPIGRERMIWTYLDGDSACPRGAFSRVGAAPKVAMGKPLPEPAPGPAPRTRDADGRPVKTGDAIRGTWSNRDERLMVRKGFEGWEIHLDRIGQGALNIAGDQRGSVQAVFPSLTCSLVAKTSGNELTLESESPNQSCPAGLYTRSQ